MKLLAVILLGVFLVTYAWGWLLSVPEEAMDTKSYTIHYLHEVDDQIHYFIEGVDAFINALKKPLPRAQARVS